MFFVYNGNTFIRDNDGNTINSVLFCHGYFKFDGKNYVYYTPDGVISDYNNIYNTILLKHLYDDYILFLNPGDDDHEPDFINYNSKTNKFKECGFIHALLKTANLHGYVKDIDTLIDNISMDMYPNYCINYNNILLKNFKKYPCERKIWNLYGFNSIKDIYDYFIYNNIDNCYYKNVRFRGKPTLCVIVPTKILGIGV